MEEKEFIQDLVNKGFSEEQILTALEERFGKKMIDPVKTETSTGSIDDMVSNLGDFSSESPTNNLYGFRVDQETQKSGISKEDYELLSNTVKKASNKFDKSIEIQDKLPNEDLNIEEKSSPDSYEDISKASQNMDYAIRKQGKFGEGPSISNELLKKEESNLAESIVSRTGRSVMHGGSLSERSNFLNTVNAIDNARYYAPEAEKINEMWNEVSNETFGMLGTERTVGDVFSGVFGTPGKNLASRENVFDITNINSSKYNANKPTSASQIAFSYDGAMPESFTGMVFDMETLRDIHLDKISEQQYSEDIKNSGNKKQFTSEVLNDGLFLLNSYQKKYKKIKDEYESSSTTKERKAELKKELEDFEFGEDLYGAEGTIDKFKLKPTSKTEKQNKFANLYNWDDIKEEDNKEAHNESIYNRAEAIASSSTKEELENMVAKSYSRLRAISKDFVAYIEDLEKMPNAERKWLESKKDEWGGSLGLTAFAEQMNLLEKVVASIDDDSTGTSAVPQKAVASLKQSFNSIKQMSESGRLPKDFTKLPGDHPYAKAWNSAIDEFIALNRAVQINVNPLTTEKDGFWAGAFQNVANRAESLGFASELTDDKAAKAFVEAITNGDTSYLDPKETKERLTSTTANTIGNGTMDLAFIAGEMAATRRVIPGIKLIKKIPSVVSGLNVVKNSNNAKKAINFAANLTANVVDESVVFGSSTALFGGTQKEIKESAKFGASMGVGNTVAGKVGQAVFSKYFKSSPFARKMYNYYTVQRASQAVQGAATGSIVFNGVNIMSEGAPLDKDGKVDAEKILESTLIEFSKMIVLGGFTGAPKKFKDLTYEVKQDLYTLRGRDAASEAAAKSFGLDHKRIDNNEDGLLDEIQKINNQKTKEVTDKLESGSISEEQAVEQIKEIENNSRTLRNRYEINQYKLRYESEKKNKLVASEDELARIGNKVLYGEKLNAKESETFSNTPLSVVLNSVGAKGKKVLNDPSQVKYIELQKDKENIINNYLQYTLEYKTQKESQERELAYNHLSKMIDTSYELQYLKGKEENSKSEKQRIKELEEQLESLENGESFRELQEIIRLGNIERYNEDVNLQREILRSTEEGELVEIETEKEFSEKYEETYNKALDTENFNTFGFYDKDAKKFYVNKERALLERRVTTGKHEGFHFVLRDSLKDENGNVSEEGKKIIDDVLNQLTPEQRELVAKRVNQSYARDERGRFVKKAEYYEENLTVLSELIASNEIQFRKEIGKALNPLTFLFRKKGFENLELSVDTGKELFNLIESYSKNEAIGLEKAKEISKAARRSKVSGLAESKEQKPKAIFMVGGPGAGKTNVGKGLKLGRRGFKVVNQDIALEAMKEEAGLSAEESEYTAEQRSLRSKLGASAVKAAKEKFNQYVSNKNDMVIDGTGASYNATMKKVKELEDAGFDVSMVVANTPLQTALDRNRARKERSLPDKIVTKTYDQVQESLAKYKQDFGDKLYEINTEAIEYGKDLPQDFLDKVYKGVGVDKRQPMYSREKKNVLEEINNLIPEGIETKEQFLSDRSFTKVYESAMNPGGAINNYIRSRTTSAMETELAVDSVLERLMNFDPQAKRKDGSTIGREGFGEFIFANTAFGKLDAKKKLFQESERKSKETRIDESTKEIADVETTVEEGVEVKEKPKINPLKFTGVPENIKLSDAPGKGLTFKKVAKQYAGEVGEKAIGIPAKKITESAANLGSVNEARAIQQFFFKADNLDKFVKILPETNIALPETQIGIETIDVSKGVQGTGLGLPKRILDYFYEDFIDPTGKLTSPKGRSKGLTSQTAVKRLKPEFRGIVSKETIDKIKKDIGITTKGELNILPKGELRSPIGQLLKGMAKTYSTLAANTLVRQEMKAAGATKQEVADVAAGKPRAMLSREKKITIEKLKKATKEKSKITSFNPTTVVTTRSKHHVLLLGKDKPIPDNKERRLIDRFALLGKELEKESGETFIDGVYRISNKFLNTKENSKFRDVFKKALTYGLDRSIIGLSAAFEMNIPRPKDYDKKTQNTTSDNSYTEKRKYSKKFHEKTKDENFHKEQDIRMEEYFDLFRAASDFVEKYPEEKSEWFWEQFFKAATNSQSHISRANFPIKTRQIDPKTKKPIFDKEGVEEHQQPQSEAVAILKNSLGNKEAMERAIKIVRKIASQGFITKENNDKLDIQYKENSPELLIDQFDRIANGEFDELPDGFLSTFRSAEADINLNELEWMPIGKTTDVVTVAEILFGTDKLPLQLADGRFIQKELYRDYLKGDKTLKQLREYGKQFEKTTEQEAKLLEVNSKLYNKAVPSRERKNYSKSILNDLSSIDKALRNARNSKAPVKGISVFDFDDTLATSKSMVGVTMPDGTETKIDATEFAKRGEELLRQGAEFDFSDFSKVVDGKPGPLITKLDKAIKKFGNKDVFVLTARPANSASAIYEFLKGLGYEIPLENITGLANSAPEAKAQWMVDKAAEGYNDFYFTDDAYKNVKAVQDAMKVLDVKSKERIVYKDIYDKMDKEMNDILEAKSGIASEKVYSKAKAEVVGSSQGKFKWFIPPSADDFVGLLYNTLAKGKLGDNQMAWYKKNLLDPYARAMNNISSERVSLAADYKALKKQLGIVPKNLRKKIEGEGFTKEQAIRMYIWNKQGMDIPGLSKTDLADMVKYVESNASLQVFADQLIEINKGDGYPEPKDYWLAGSITTDLMDGLGGTKRAKHLEEWQQNVDVIFSEKNLNKLQAIHGKPYREALENMLQRMKSGRNRNYAGDSTTGRMMDWLNGSIGAIMFLNTRSAVLQTLSAVNFINFKDNNILAAGKAFANQPQYWKDFKELFNSDFLKERRDNAAITINESDIADMANKGGAKGAISYLLQKGFTPTQIADSFAIASGGATFYRNRIKTYIKEGMSETEAKEKAFIDFRETAEESQQSSRPDRISKQQAGPLGRVVLAFANTPSQYARIIKKASQDLMANRGDAKTNISKIIYYGAIQGFIFNAIQQALFAADLDDEDEKTEKMVRLGNGMADGVLRGMGVSGAAVTVVKNAGLRVYNESQKDRPKYEKVAFELTKLSPPIASKLSRINQAAREVQWNSDEMKQKGLSLDNPAWLAAGNVISATTNVPLDRVIKKVNNVNDALSQDLEMQERIALLAGWQSWELGIEDEKENKEKTNPYKSKDNNSRSTRSSVPIRVDRRKAIRIKR